MDSYDLIFDKVFPPRNGKKKEVVKPYVPSPIFDKLFPPNKIDFYKKKDPIQLKSILRMNLVKYRKMATLKFGK